MEETKRNEYLSQLCHEFDIDPDYFPVQQLQRELDEAKEEIAQTDAALRSAADCCCKLSNSLTAQYNRGSVVNVSNAFTQRALANTLRRDNNRYVMEWISRLFLEPTFPQVMVNQAEYQAGLNAEPSVWVEPKWELQELNVEGFMYEVDIYICANDVDKETGIAKEIGFCLWRSPVDQYGIKVRGKERVKNYNGALINHGTIIKPRWSIHT